MTHIVRHAGPADVSIIVELMEDARAWLASSGSDQWQYAPRVDRIQAAVAAGSAWIAESDHRPVATITIDGNADPEFWTWEDDPDSAMYVHRLVVNRSAAGRELGTALLDWSSRRASAAGLRWQRLDAWASNEDLHRYYQTRGWTHLRTVRLPHRGSGALFQRPAGAQTGTGPDLVEK